MYKQLRKQSLKTVFPRVIVCALALIILLAVSGGGLSRLLAGPSPLAEQSLENGKYVSFDASEVIVAFATLSVNSDSGSETIKTYYLLPFGEEQYIAVVDDRENNGNVLERAMEQSHEYYLGDLEELTRLGSLSGTVAALESDMLGYMSDCIDSYELPGYAEGQDSGRLILSYQVELDHVGFLTTAQAKVLGALAGVFLLLLIVQLAVVFAGVYQKQVRAAVGEEVTDEDFSQAAEIERIRVGSYIWYTKGPGSRAVKTSNVIWGYAMPEPMVVSKYRWPVALYTTDQTLIRINFMEKKHCQVFLDAIAEQGYPFISGYTSQFAELFQSDFEEFRKAAAAAAGERKA